MITGPGLYRLHCGEIVQIKERREYAVYRDGRPQQMPVWFGTSVVTGAGYAWEASGELITAAEQHSDLDIQERLVEEKA